MSVQPITVADERLLGRRSFESIQNAQSGLHEQNLSWWDWWARLARVLSALPPSTWMLVDLGAILTGVPLAYWLFPPFELETTPHIALWQALAIFSFSVAMASMVFGLYERETIRSRSRIATRMALTTAAGAVLAYTLIYVMMYSTISRRIAALVMSFLLVYGVAVRLVAWYAVHRLMRGVIIVGPKALFDSFQKAKQRGLLHEYSLIGHVSTATPDEESRDNPHYLGAIDEQLDLLSSRGVTDVVISAEAARDSRLMDWLSVCLRQGCRVTNEAVFYEKATGQILVDELTPDWFLFADLNVHCDRQATLKRVSDVAIALAGLLLSAPLWPVIALAIKLCDRGPVLYSQKRVGQHGRIFTLYKFRTMTIDAENGKSLWASPDDPRVTRVGRLLRRTRLDELPQFFNILIGDMSLVGPRPERPDLLETLSRRIPFFPERNLVKPGLTGWAQISFRYGSSIEDAKQKLQFDLYYLKHMGFELDMIILLRTIGTFLRGAC